MADQAAAAVASSITVRGNQRVEAATIRAYMTIKVGANYNALDLDSSTKALYGTGLFADVSVVPSGAVIVVTVVENPVVSSVVFEGNKKVKSELLVAIVSLEARGILTDAKVQADIATIKDYYARNARADAAVFPRITRLPDNRADVTFVIDEGDRTGVASITFVGNSAFPAQRLKSVIQTRRSNWLSWLNKRDVYSEDRLAADQEALRRFYLEHGYADFQVLSADAAQGADGQYHITFTLDEGPKYTIGAVSVDSSIPGVDAGQLNRVVKTRSGSVFDASEVEKSVEDLTIELSRLGFVFAQVRPRGDRDYVNHVITITYVVDEGPRAYIERIEIRGNTKTRDYVIRREFEISEGDAYNRVLIDKAERRLRNLGYFSQVQISAQQGSAPDKVIVVVNVADQSTGSFSIAGGVSTSQGLIAEISLEESNFLGRGQRVKISVSGGKSDRSYNVSFTEPYFMGYRVSAGFDAHRTTSKATSYRPFEQTSTGGGLRVGLPLNDQLRLDLNYKINNQDVSGAVACDIGGAGTVGGCYFPNGTTLTSSAGYALTYSTIDNYGDPHEGIFLKLTQDFAGIGGDVAYMRTVGDARWYRPISQRSDIVGLLRVQGGNITGLGKPVAIGDNFFKGGETIRGFANLGYGPRDTTPGVSDGGIALGGKTFANATAEVQFPFPLLPPDFGLKGAIFADAGVLFGVDAPSCAPTCTFVDDTAIRSSVGASVMWASPFGLLRLDIAQALSKQSYDQTQLIRIGAGATF